MTTKLLTKTEVNKMVKAIELSANQSNAVLEVTKDKEFIKIEHKGRKIFRALKTNGPWLVTYDQGLFE